MKVAIEHLHVEDFDGVDDFLAALEAAGAAIWAQATGDEEIAKAGTSRQGAPGQIDAVDEMIERVRDTHTQAMAKMNTEIVKSAGAQ